MLRMSFYNNTLDRALLKDFITRTSKPIKYTYGLGYRNPTIYKASITKEKALQIVDRESLLDANEYEDYLHLNAFSENDMW